MSTNGWQLNNDNVAMTRDEFVAAKIRQFIREGDFEPGQKLDQSELADRLNVSRSPVREALRTLAAEGLVRTYPHRGSVVAELSLNDLEEICDLRGLAEGRLAYLGAPKLTDENIATLQTLLEASNQTTDLDRWLDFNQRFHHTLYQAANRPRFLALVQSLRNSMAPYIREYVTSSKHMLKTQIDHKRIFEACLKRDGELAKKETRIHLQNIYEAALKATKTNSALSFGETS